MLFSCILTFHIGKTVKNIGLCHVTILQLKYTFQYGESRRKGHEGRASRENPTEAGFLNIFDRIIAIASGSIAKGVNQDTVVFL